MYEPILMSKSSWDDLSDEQQKALTAASQKAEDYMTEQAKLLDDKAVDVFEKAGVEVVSMSAEDAAAWRAIAQEPSYKIFADKVPGRHELNTKALAVEYQPPDAVEGRRGRQHQAPHPFPTNPD